MNINNKKDLEFRFFVLFCIFQTPPFTLAYAFAKSSCSSVVVVCHYLSHKSHENLKGEDHEKMQELEKKKQAHKDIIYYFSIVHFNVFLELLK